jgi:hypothetical protein
MGLANVFDWRLWYIPEKTMVTARTACPREAF